MIRAVQRPQPADRPHDILAAEEFAMPTVDPELHHGPVRLPDDPSGIAEAHDVLAAEEFAMPAPRPQAGIWVSSSASDRARAGGVVAAMLGLWLLVRVLRRR
jgi:hypothetical protein